MHIRAIACLTCSIALAAEAQRPVLAPAVRAYVSVDTPVVALTNARVIDGTGAPPREGQTVIIRMDASWRWEMRPTFLFRTRRCVSTHRQEPASASVMVHEHLYYPTVGAPIYGNYTESFTRLYLAGGVTSMRTGGNMNGYSELNVAKAIERGEKPGPWIDATAPYLNGPNSFSQMQSLRTPDEARRFVNFWADQGATSFKAYMQIRRDVLGAAIDEAHKRRMKVTGHLCSVTYREAAELGIDNLEHGFLAATDFAADKKPDECPGQGRGQVSVNALDPQGAEIQGLIRELIKRGVAITSTLTVFETFTPGRPSPPGLDVLAPQFKDAFERRFAANSQNTRSLYSTLFTKAMALERAFAKAGGLLIAGTDPTGGGGVIPGYSNQRMIELLVEAGFSPVEAIRIATLNGATYLGRSELVGSIVVGKQADLLVVNGNPAERVSDIRNVEVVFRQGVGYDPARLIGSVKGSVGFW
jgi:enamidase